MDVSPASPIGYYVHHHGTGHMRRALNIIKHISSPMVMFSSLEKPADLPEMVTYVRLPSDAVTGYQQPTQSAFHYTPYEDAIFERNRLLTDSWQTMNIRHIYVDVSIEVAVLAKLYGLTVGHAIMQGNRTDKPHTYGYDACDYLLACMAPSFDIPANRTTSTPVSYAGGISRFASHEPQPLKSCRTVAVMLSPTAEQAIQNGLIQLATYAPDIMWHCIGFTVDTGLDNIVSHGPVEDPQALLEAADIVIGAGGNNTIMEIASLGKPFICIPEPRPFDEQVTAAKALQALNAAVYLQHFPTPSDWAAIVEKTRQLDMSAFTDLVSDNAAQRAADIIEHAGKI